MTNYQLNITFSGADLTLAIMDSAHWAPGDSLLIFGASANAQTSASTVIQQPTVHFKSQDGATNVDASLTISISSSLGTVSLSVSCKGTVTVKSPVDSFTESGAGPSAHVLKLR